MEDYRVGFQSQDNFLVLEKTFCCLVLLGWMVCEGSEQLRQEEYQDLELHEP